MKQNIIKIMYALCESIDGASQLIPLGPLGRLGCPRGLGLWAWRLEERWYPRDHQQPKPTTPTPTSS